MNTALEGAGRVCDHDDNQDTSNSMDIDNPPPPDLDDGALWLQNVDDLRAVLPPGALITLHPKAKFYILWNTARTKPASLLADDRLHISGDGYASIHIREEYKIVYDDTCALYDKGERLFKTPIEYEDELTFDELPPARPLPQGDIANHRVAMILTGHPGIGKSIWLRYALARRLLEGKPVIFQASTSLFVFNSAGVFQINVPDYNETIAEGLRACLHPSTWYLFDSNSAIRHPPAHLLAMALFIVQATSPRLDRIEWVRKTPYAQINYVMRPPTLQEIVEEAGLQDPPLDRSAIPDFYEKYGPSARQIYKMVIEGSDERHKNSIESQLKGLSFEKFDLLLPSWTFVDHQQEAFLKIVLVAPGRYRHETHVDIVTHFVFRLVHNRYTLGRPAETARLYEKLLTAPGTRDPSGILLKLVVHEMLPRGGVWPLKVMHAHERGKGKDGRDLSGHLWKSDVADKPSKYLIIQDDDTARIEDVSEPDARCQLPVRTFFDMQRPTLEDGYYLPAVKNQAAFDSFVYSSRTHTITLFQITVSKTHSVETTGIKWLSTLRAAGDPRQPTIIYVAVTPNDTMSLPFTPAVEKLVAKQYHMQVRRIPVHAPSEDSEQT